MVDQVRANGTWVIVDFGSGKYGYLDHGRFLHYLPWEYDSVKAAKGKLAELVRNGEAAHRYFVRRGAKVEDLMRESRKEEVDEA